MTEEEIADEVESVDAEEPETLIQKKDKEIDNLKKELEICKKLKPVLDEV